jgi:FKBP-type peptidyl-prolyl cis-trans isomerase
MKSKHIATICLLALGLAAARAQETKAGSAPQAPAAAAFTEAQIMEELGWYVGKRAGLDQLDLNEANVKEIVKGIMAAAAGKNSPYELEKIGPQMDEFMKKKEAATLSKLKEKNNQAAEEYFKKLETNKAVLKLPSGLRYEIVKQGDGAAPKATDTVKVHYTGTLVDGSVFDSSVQRGEPAEFPLDQVIPGWTEGIQKVNKGGKIKLYVPANLAYGDDGRPGIPPGSTLIFDVELLDIKAAGAAAPAPQPTKK